MTRGQRSVADRRDPSQVVAYLRVSTDEQGESGAGLAAQEESIGREVERRGWNLVESYTDIASGKSRAMRPGLDRALADVREGRAGTLMVAKLDRLSRSMADFANIMAEAKKRKFNIVAIDLGVDLSTPSGGLISNMMASVAEWEREIIAQRTVEALRAKRAEGVILGRPRTVPDEVRDRIIAAREDGKSYYAIAKELNRDEVPTGQGGARWYGSTVRVVAVGGAA